MSIPLTSIALNLLSIGAAYGVLTLVFQDGHLHGPLGFSPYGAIVPWMPLFMFVLLFGLSMDYHVFILSRIRELRLRGMPTPEAITTGIGASAGVVTSAAVIMVAVFSIFATLSVIEFKMIGIGLATAILIDATVVRGILLPAAMSLLGERNWYLPRWLAWLPGGRGRPAAAAVTRGRADQERRPGYAGGASAGNPRKRPALSPSNALLARGCVGCSFYGAGQRWRSMGRRRHLGRQRRDHTRLLRHADPPGNHPPRAEGGARG